MATVHQLKSLILDELSLVPLGMNQHADVVLHKAAAPAVAQFWTGIDTARRRKRPRVMGTTPGLPELITGAALNT